MFPNKMCKWVIGVLNMRTSPNHQKYTNQNHEPPPRSRKNGQEGKGEGWHVLRATEGGAVTHSSWEIYQCGRWKAALSKASTWHRNVTARCLPTINEPRRPKKPWRVLAHISISQLQCAHMCPHVDVLQRRRRLRRGKGDAEDGKRTKGPVDGKAKMGMCRAQS